MPKHPFRTAAPIAMLTAAMLVLPAQHVMAGPLGAFAGDAIEYDLDGDGRVTREEFETVKAQKFDEADTNADGTLSADEMQALVLASVAERQQAAFDAADADADGFISLAEFTDARPHASAAALEVIFGLIDLDTNNLLDQTEWAILRSDEGKGLMRYALMDSNGDGSISESEFTNRVSHGGFRSELRGSRKGHGRWGRGR